MAAAIMHHLINVNINIIMVSNPPSGFCKNNSRIQAGLVFNNSTKTFHICHHEISHPFQHSFYLNHFGHLQEDYEDAPEASICYVAPPFSPVTGAIAMTKKYSPAATSASVNENEIKDYSKRDRLINEFQSSDQGTSRYQTL